MAGRNAAKVNLFVEKSRRQWVVRDPDGQYWILPAVERPWERRLPYLPTDESALEPVPRHYVGMLGLPF